MAEGVLFEPLKEPENQTLPWLLPAESTSEVQSSKVFKGAGF